MNRTVEAVLKISARLGSMGALTTIQQKMAAVDRQATAYNRTAAATARAHTAMAATARFIGPAVAGYAGVNAVRQFASVERQLTRIGLTLGAEREEMAAMRSEMERTARAYALPAEELMDSVAAYAAAGATFGEIRSDLDMIAKAQQALGASGTDVVNTWDAARKSLGLGAKDAQRFFELVGAGAAAGKFEGYDMAAHLPTLLPVASKQGFTGNQGAARMIAFLEVMRDFVGDASEATTATADLLEKISAPDVIKRFKKAGIDLRRERQSAIDSGQSMFERMHDVLMRATRGDASRLGEFFGDKEARRAADVILRHFERIKAAQDEIERNAPGVLDRNNAELLKDAEAGLTRIAETRKRLEIAGGNFLIEAGTVDAIDAVANDIERMTAALKGGWTPGDSLKALLAGESPSDVVDRYAWKGGLRTPERQKKLDSAGAMNADGGVFNRMLGGLANAAIADEMPPIPTWRPDDAMRADWLRQDAERRFEAARRWRDTYDMPMPYVPTDTENARNAELTWAEKATPGRDALRDVMFDRMPAQGNAFDGFLNGMDKLGDEMRSGGEDAGRSITEGGDGAAEAIRDAANALVDAGRQIAAELRSALAGGVRVHGAGLTVGDRPSGATVRSGRTMVDAGGVSINANTGRTAARAGGF